MKLQTPSNILALILITSLAIWSHSALANTNKRSVRAPDPNQFCKADAENLMKKLSDLNQAKTDQIKDLVAQIKDLEKSNEVMMQINHLKNKYEEGLEKIKNKNDQNGNDSNKKVIADHLDQMKTVIRNGVTLQAISLMMKEMSEEELKKT